MKIGVKQLATMASDQLTHIAESIDHILSSRATVAKAREQITKDLQSQGLSLSDVVGNVGKGTKKAANGAGRHAKVAPKWKHKAIPELTWSGRGRTPKWIKKFGIEIKA